MRLRYETTMRRLAENRPYLFSIGLFIVQLALPLPVVGLFRLIGLQLEPLRLIIPVVESVFVVGVIWYLGWFRASGFIGRVGNVQVYWYPLLLAFVPALLRGSVEIAAGDLLFYTAALVFTGISEEGFARGLVLRSVLPKGKWIALFFAAALFSVGHFTNLFFEDFGPVEMGAKLLTTFAFATLYGAIYLRTFNIWPLIALHTIHDYIFVTSGTAGPFATEPLPLGISAALDVASIAFGIYVAWRADPETFFAHTAKADA
jgi:membrane protease YdiL (CAAX protease family)